MNILIIGNGVTGISCARFIRKQSDHNITIISAESKHFYSRTALMYIYMGHMTYENTKPYEDWFWEKNRINLVHDYVTQVDANNKQVRLKNGQPMNYDKLVLAVGSTYNKFGWQGQDLDGVQGLYSLQDLDALEKNTTEYEVKRAVIVGGGLIGIELAEMLLSRNIKVTMLVRETEYWNNVLPKEEAALIGRHIREHHIDLRLATELKAILPDENGRAKAVLTNKGETIDCQLVGLTAGVRPNTGFLKDSGIELGRGVLVNPYLETNVPDVYAAGDCAQFREPLPKRRSIEQVWYTGKRQGATLANTLCGKRTKYSPRLWFNSAKFLDIEYQTYGTVLNKLREGEKQFYWEHADGKKCLKMVYAANSNQLLGINVFGIRLRHEVCEKWLLDKQTIQTVVQNLAIANFDPEFYASYENDILTAFNQQTGSNLVLSKKKRGLKAALAFLKK